MVGIPVSVSDMLKLLDQVPLWKSLVALPKRVAALEEKLAALEASGRQPQRAGPRPDECPGCRVPLRLVSERRHPQFGPMGVKRHEMVCDACGTIVERDWSPERGYG